LIMDTKDHLHRQLIVVFEERGSGDLKIAGIEVYGRGLTIAEVHSIDQDLPPVIDDPETFFPAFFHADLVLDFLRHPDLVQHLVTVCSSKGIPVISSGKHIAGAITPPTCCSLGKRSECGAYAERFGVPEYKLVLKEERIVSIEADRGAPCGATWQVIPRIIGQKADEAVPLMGREIQYLCAIDPSAFDPVSGKSMLHHAGEVHMASLEKAISRARRRL